MSAPLKTLESRLAGGFGLAEAALFGRARSGFAALLDILGAGRDYTVVMPSNICPSVYAVPCEAGAKTALVDIDPANGLPSDSAMAEAVRTAKGSGLVMVTHLYGFVQDYPETIKASKEHGWFVLENDSLATKSEAAGGGEPFGDALLVSFGYAKTIEAGGGGAVIANDNALVRDLRSRAAAFGPIGSEALSGDHKLMLDWRRARKMPLVDPARAAVGENLLKTEIRLLRYAFSNDLLDPLNTALSALSENIVERREAAGYWGEALARLGTAVVAPDVLQTAPWRVIRRIPGARDAAVGALRERRYDAGTNYPPLKHLFPTRLADTAYPGGETWGREVINLWTGRDYGRERIEQACDVIAQAISEDGGVVCV